MLINTIWASHDGTYDNAWLVTAWDEFSIDNNPSGWEEEVKKLEEAQGKIWIVPIKCDGKALSNIFEPSPLDGEIKNDAVDQGQES